MRLLLSPDTEARVLAAALAHPRREPVRYPRWYLQHWHFLPDGYLSARGPEAYELLIPRLYNAGREPSMLRALGNAVGAHGARRVLELGCGPGHALAALGRRLPAAELTGVDLSPFQLDHAAAAVAPIGDRVRLRHASTLDLPFEDDAFDAVVAVHHIGHVPARAQEDILAEAARVLSASGRLYLIDHAWHPSPPIAGARSRERLAGGLLRLDEIAPGVPALRPLLAFQPGAA